MCPIFVYMLTLFLFFLYGFKPITNVFAPLTHVLRIYPKKESSNSQENFSILKGLPGQYITVCKNMDDPKI